MRRLPRSPQSAVVADIGLIKLDTFGKNGFYLLGQQLANIFATDPATAAVVL